MRNPIALSLAVTFAALTFAAADAAASAADPSATEEEEPMVVASMSRLALAERPWVVRAEGGFVGMRDNWLRIPGAEVGLTLGRYVTPYLSFEATGRARDVDDNTSRSWSAMALARVVVLATATGRHALTVAAGPFFEIGNRVHGTVPFAHAEIAYVYRHPSGFTAMAGAGPNMALARSSYVAPPVTDSCQDSGGDAFVFCLDFGSGPDAQEIHAGDALSQMRLAFGWQF